MKQTLLKTNFIFGVLCLVAVNAFSQSAEDIKMKIEKMNKEMAQAMVEGNSEKSLSYYTKDAVSLPSYSKICEGIEAIKMSNSEMMKSGMKVKSFESKTKKVILDDKLITEIGTYKISVLMPGSEMPMDDMGKYVTIWEKQQDGSLKIKVETWNTDANPWEKEKM